MYLKLGHRFAQTGLPLKISFLEFKAATYKMQSVKRSIIYIHIEKHSYILGFYNDLFKMSQPQYVLYFCKRARNELTTRGNQPKDVQASNLHKSRGRTTELKFSQSAAW